MFLQFIFTFYYLMLLWLVSAVDHFEIESSNNENLVKYVEQKNSFFYEIIEII